MAIKGGSILQQGRNVLLDRIQTGGPGQVSIPETKIQELGNYEAVGYVLDTPDISYSLESVDASVELEALLTGGDAGAAAGTVYDLSTCKPIDVLGQFKPGKDMPSPYDVIGCAVAPYLMPESIEYRFGLQENGSINGTLRGDAIYYNRGSAYVQEFTGVTGSSTLNLTNPAYPYNGDAVTGIRYTLSVSDSDGKRYRLGVDYTENATGGGESKSVSITMTGTQVPSGGGKLYVVYTSPTTATFLQAVHPTDSAVRPAAIRGRHVEVKIGGLAWTDVQSASASWRLTLDSDLELGNDQVVSRDFDQADVSGTIQIKPRSPGALFDKLKVITGVSSDNEVMGALQRAVLPVELILHSPTDGSVLKTIYCPDAQFSLPGFNGQVNTKTTLDINYTSRGGILHVIKGARSDDSSSESESSSESSSSSSL